MLKLDLSRVSKPLRYAGGEPGSVYKEPKNLLRFCLVFPDIYEIGMSHTGYRIIYTRLNESPAIYAERFFAPWPDSYETFGKDILVSLESKYPVQNFDVVGFSVQYEMSYGTIVRLLDMAGISPLAENRGEAEPIVIAGGSCVLNPAPLSAFIDVFFMGEMDEVLRPAMEELHRLRQSGAPRMEQLLALDKYPFTYVPSINPDKQVNRAIYSSFSEGAEHLEPLVPLMSVTQDRVAAEIARGCTNGCRFCQAGMIYRPVREKSVANLCGFITEQIDATGYLEASLLSLDSGDYTQIEPLLESLNSVLTPRRVGMALPSLRAETVSPSLMSKVSSVRKSGFTIAPEAGSQRLRDIINKNLSEEQILNAALYAKNAGYNGAKLYFMCGLPFETDEDILAIAELVKKIQYVTKGGRFFNLTVSVSNFVPKPFTPFERCGQASAEVLQRRHQLLRDALRKNSAKLRFHDIYTSTLEAAISRGGSEWRTILLLALEKGFYLDAWSEFFSKERWDELFNECGLSLNTLAQQAFEPDKKLPWGNINCGASLTWLAAEMEKAIRGETTADCRHNPCTNCGVCDFKTIKNTNAPTVFGATLPATPPFSGAYTRFELKYSKTGSGALLSALDTARIFAHMLLSQGVRLRFTEGFNPGPRMVTQAPLPVGVCGTEESVLFEAEPASVTAATMARLNNFAPKGIEILSLQQAQWPKNMSRYEMVFSFDEGSFAFLNEALKDNTAVYEKTAKDGKAKTINLLDYLIDVNAAQRSMRVSVTEKGGFHFPEFFRKAGYDKVPVITRTRLKAVE